MKELLFTFKIIDVETNRVLRKQDSRSILNAYKCAKYEASLYKQKTKIRYGIKFY